ncbi:50S ribosomal protein L32 [Patescibacteria group bacterium]|nr:50S ribosomal protein L32 [Patescibacteria group bacterium]
MAVPKRHKTSSTRDMRRMHLFIASPRLTLCKKCNKPIKPHIVCKNCGYYKGKEEIDVLGKLTKKERKLRERDIQKTEKEKPLSAQDLSKK